MTAAAMFCSSVSSSDLFWNADFSASAAPSAGGSGSGLSAALNCFSSGHPIARESFFRSVTTVFCEVRTSS